MDCVVISSSRGSSRSGDRKPMFHMSPALAGRFFTNSTTWEALFYGCCCSVAQLCLTLCYPMNCSTPRLLCPWNCPGKNTGMCCHFLLQETFLTQRSNPCLLHLLHHWATWEAHDSVKVFILFLLLLKVNSKLYVIKNITMFAVVIFHLLYSD